MIDSDRTLCALNKTVKLRAQKGYRFAGTTATDSLGDRHNRCVRKRKKPSGELTLYGGFVFAFFGPGKLGMNGEGGTSAVFWPGRTRGCPLVTVTWTKLLGWIGSGRFDFAIGGSFSGRLGFWQDWGV